MSAKANGAKPAPMPLESWEKDELLEIQREQLRVNEKAAMWTRMVEGRLGLQPGGLSNSAQATHIITEEGMVEAIEKQSVAPVD